MSAIDKGARPFNWEKSAIGAPAGALALLAHPLTTLVLLLIAAVEQAAGHIDSDVSWLITVGEKFLAGVAPYADIVEPNPPMSFLSLAPAILIAQLLHMPVEPVLVALVFAGALIAFGLGSYALRLGAPRSGLEWRLMLNGAIWLALIAPALLFAQREHLALLAMAPLLAGLSVDRSDGRMPRIVCLLQGIGGGVAVAFKPFFGLAVLLPALAVAWRERSPRVLLTLEFIAFSVASVVSVAAIWIFFPAYFTRIVPFNLDVYSAAPETLSNFLTPPLGFIYLALAIGLVTAGRGTPRGVAPLIAFWASVGFFLCFLAQRKGWINHAYPALALILFSWLLFVVEEARMSPGGGVMRWPLVKFFFLPAFVATPLFFGVIEQFSDGEEFPGLRAAVAAHTPAHPRLMALSANCSVGHPLTRRLQGRWVMRPCALWASVLATQLWSGSETAPAYRARLEAYRRQDMAGFAEDVDKGRPDAIIIETPGLRDWALRQPVLAAAMAPFEKAAVAGGTEVWTRRK